MIPSGLISISVGSSGAVRMSAASFENGSVERPWNERVQSCDVSPSSRTNGASERPDLRFGVGVDEVEEEDGVDDGVSDGWATRWGVVEMERAWTCRTSWL